MKKIMLIVLVSVAGLLLIGFVFMAANRILPIGMRLHKPIYQTDNIALDGYDVTTYFTGDLSKGITDNSYDYLDATWHFSNKENLERFKNDPEHYLPQFGGYCSKAISTGFAAPANPSVYTLYNGKLYIFSDEKVKKEFIEDPDKIILACEKKWK